MEVKIKNNNINIIFNSNYSDVTEFLGSKKGRINTNIGSIYCGYITYMSYVIAYYELDLEHTYTKEEVKMLVDTNKIVLLESKPYMVLDSGIIDTDKSFTTLKEYDFNNKENNSENNNKLVCDMLKEYKLDISCKKR